MARLLVALVVILIAVVQSKEIPDPVDIAFVLSENEFEDYLDLWLEHKSEVNQLSTAFSKSESGKKLCTILFSHIICILLRLYEGAKTSLMCLNLSRLLNLL